MKRSKQEKPALPVEYCLYMTLAVKEQEKEPAVLVQLQTVQEFNSFRYEIVVKDSIQDNSLRLEIHGLRAPQQILPAMGPATFRKEYRQFTGTKEIVVSKIDGEENSYLVDISKQGIVVKRSPTKKFVELVTKPQK